MRRFFVWCSLFVVVTCGHAIAAEPSIDELIEAGHFKRARAKLKTGTQPANAEEAYQMSRIALAFGDPDGALKHAERAASLEPENARYHVQVAMAAGTSAQRAGVFKQISLAERIKDELEIALGLDKKNVAAYSTLILFYLNAPGIAGGDKGKAKALAEELRSIDPVRGWLAKVQVAREEKKLDQLEGLYLKAAEADPQSYAGQVAAASYFGSQKNYPSEEKYARAAIAIDPGRAGGYVRLADALAGAHRWRELDAALSDSERKVPDNLTPFFAVGAVLLQQGEDLERAEANLRKYLTQDPEGGSPSRAVGRWRLGLVLEKRGRKKEAVAEIEAALKEQPDLKDAKKDLERLKQEG